MQKTPPYFDPVALRQKLTKFYHDAGNPADARPVILEQLKELIVVARDSARSNLESSGNGRACAAALSYFQDELIRIIYDYIIYSGVHKGKRFQNGYTVTNL